MGNKRHWFGRPSTKGFKLSGSVFREDASFIQDPRVVAMNTRANNFVLAHEHLVPVIKKINELTRPGSGVDLGTAMRLLDVQSNG
jgi:hypothetical protein